jgi:hypothetical protein
MSPRVNYEVCSSEFIIRSVLKMGNDKTMIGKLSGLPGSVQGQKGGFYRR